MDEPRTPLEARLAELWREKLMTPAVGIHDDFFELGGHSMLAADLLLDVHEEFGVEVPTWVLFMNPTIDELARAISEARATAGQPTDG